MSEKGAVKPADFSLIAKRLHSRKAEDRLRAIMALERDDSSEAALLLVEAMKDRISYVGAAAARAVIPRATPDIAAALVEHFAWAAENGLDRDPGCSVRIELAVALGNLRHAPAEADLRQGLWTTQIEMVGMGPDDTGIGLRANCALALAQIRPRGLAVDLALLLFDAGPQVPIPTDTLTVRRAAAQSLALLGDPASAIPLILKLQSAPDEDPDVLVECMTALAALGEPRALEFIGPYLENANGFLAAGAAMALGRTREEAVLPHLLKALDGSRPALRAALALATASLRIPAARDSLLERTRDASYSMRTACAAALAGFSDPAAQDRLRDLAALDPHAGVRQAAQAALGEKPT